MADGIPSSAARVSADPGDNPGRPDVSWGPASHGMVTGTADHRRRGGEGRDHRQSRRRKATGLSGTGEPVWLAGGAMGILEGIETFFWTRSRSLTDDEIQVAK